MRGFGQGMRWRYLEVVGDRWGTPKVALSGGTGGEMTEEAGLGEPVVALTHPAGRGDGVSGSGGALTAVPYRRHPVAPHPISPSAAPS